MEQYQIDVMAMIDSKYTGLSHRNYLQQPNVWLTLWSKQNRRWS